MEYCVSNINDLIEDISTDNNLPYDEFTEEEKEVQQLLSELEKTNEFLLLNLDESQHYQFLDETLAVKRNSRRKFNLVRRKLKVSSDLVNNSRDTQTRLPTNIQQQTLQNESEHREIPQETFSASTGITLSSNQPATLQNTETSNLYFYASNTRNLFDQTTFPQHQASFGLTICHDHAHRQQFITTLISSGTLPTLKLDTFNGNSLTWTDWIPLFESVIDSRPLSNTENIKHLQSILTGPAKSLVKGYGCNGKCYHQPLADLKKKYGKASVILNAYLEKLVSYPSPSAQRPKSFDIFRFFINDLVNTFTRLEYKNDLKTTMNTQVAIQKLPYSQLVDWSKHCAQDQIESPSLEQFAERLSLTAQIFENLEPFFRNKLGKNDPKNFSQCGNNHSRYDPNHIQGTSRYVSTQDKSSAMPTTSKFNREHSQHQRQFKSSRNQQQQLEDQNVPQTSRASKCLFEDGNQRIYKCEKFKNISVKQRKDAIYQLKACFKECPSTQSCSSCNKRQHTHLHDESSQSANSTHCSTAGSAELPSLLQILPVTLSRDGKSVNTYAFLDNGSVVSMMITKTASALGIVLDKKLNTQNYTKESMEKSVTFTNLSIKGMGSCQTFDIEDVQVLTEIEFPQYNLEWIRKVCQEFDHLKHIAYPDVDINQISILIGCDNFDLIAHREIHYGPANTARAVQTELGWTASGKTDLNSAVACQSLIVKTESRECCETDETLYNEVLNWYKVENLPSNKDGTKSEINKRASDILESTLEFKEGRYHVGFLWKN